MQVGDNGEGRARHHCGVEAGVTVDPGPGTGNVRLEEHLLVTLDVQFQSDQIDGAPNPKGWVIGGRVVVEF